MTYENVDIQGYRLYKQPGNTEKDWKHKCSSCAVSHYLETQLMDLSREDE